MKGRIRDKIKEDLDLVINEVENDISSVISLLEEIQSVSQADEAIDKLKEIADYLY